MGKKNKKKNRSGSIDHNHQTPSHPSSQPLQNNNAVTGAAASANNTASYDNIEQEDLSLQRHDEETVLSAIYGDDFTLESGAWNCPVYKLRIRPASDVTDHHNLSDKNGNNGGEQHNHHPNNTDVDEKNVELTLSIQLTNKYPYTKPLIQIQKSIGLQPTHLSDLLIRLGEKAEECSSKGSVMGWEMGQVCEDYLMEFIERRDKLEREREEMLKRLDNRRGTDGKKQEDEEEEDEEAEQSALLPNDEESGQEIGVYDGQDISMDSDTKKEFARQMEALNVAAKLRSQRRRNRQGVAGLGGLPSIADNDNDEDDLEGAEDLLEWNDDLDLDDFQGATAASSRYQSDFVELKPLGKGGGGEVVQAINRLDRRVYAIKKIFLEPEESKLAMVQNEKLLREVVTISRMTHKNIVRYYQAWVEEPPRIEEGGDVTENRLESAETEKMNNNDEEDSTSWGDDEESSSSSGSFTSNDSREEDGSQQNIATQTLKDYSRSHSLDNFLEHEADAIDFENPLFFAGSNELLPSPLPPQKKHSDSDWTEAVTEKSRRDRKILYIQMEYCKTTMRDMIDESKLSLDAVWKSLRQILEALVYIHGQNLIHRDLKPANIFFDSEGEVRLGDFGLATRTSGKKAAETETNSEADMLYEAIDNISGLLERRASVEDTMDSITGGVGTPFYIAPEQEHGSFLKSKHGASYDSRADIFSLGISAFEMFNPNIFSTYMERAETLTCLRGDPRDLVHSLSKEASAPLFTKDGTPVGDWTAAADRRLPTNFRTSVPENAQKLILWCTDPHPANRPTAKQILNSRLMPRKMELEQKYLDEVLQTLSNPQSDTSYQQILSKIFKRPIPTHVLTTYDNDVALKANNTREIAAHVLKTTLDNIKGSHWGSHSMNYTSPMSSCAVSGAITSLRRAENVGMVTGGGKEGEGLRGAPQQVATIMASATATAAAVTGADGVIGPDPRIVEWVCSKLSSIFQSHGAVHLSSPLLKPRDTLDMISTLNQPAQVVNSRGSALVLKQDLTVNFARSISRGGAATNNIKRYEIGKCFLESDAGGHPKGKVILMFA